MDIDWITDESDWAAALAGAGRAPLQQSWAYGQAMARLGARVRRVVLHHGGQTGAAQMLERRGLRLINRAPLASRPLLRRLARQPGLTLATSPLRGPGVVPLMTDRFHAEWDLRPEPAALQRALSRDWRARLLQATARITQGDARAMAEIAARDAAQAQARDYRPLPPAFLQAWPGEVLTLQYRPDGPLSAGIVVLIHGNEASYHCAFADAQGRAAQAHRAMLWQAALALRARGITRFDLGAIDSATPGLARFKLGTGAALVSLGPASLILPG